MAALHDPSERLHGPNRLWMSQPSLVIHLNQTLMIFEWCMVWLGYI